jgi:hypothetical protein
MYFFFWLECEGEGKEAESACNVVAPDKDKAMDCFKHVVYPQYHQFIRFEQVEEMVANIGYISWACWQYQQENYPKK